MTKIILELFLGLMLVLIFKKLVRLSLKVVRLTTEKAFSILCFEAVYSLLTALLLVLGVSMFPTRPLVDEAKISPSLAYTDSNAILHRKFLGPMNQVQCL